MIRSSLHVMCIKYLLGTIIKQADVILLGFPFMWNMTHEIRRKDLETYETVSGCGLLALMFS